MAFEPCTKLIGKIQNQQSSRDILVRHQQKKDSSLVYVWFAHTRIDMASSKAIAETYALCCRSLFQKALFELRAQPTDDAYDDGAKLFGRCSTAHRTGSTYLILPMLLD